jgi:hypothetical protein
MLRVGLRALDRHRRLVAMLYLAELAMASTITLAVGWSLSTVFAHRPIFDRGVAGDLAALAQAFDGRIDLVLALLAASAAVALAWGVFSWYLGAGLTGVLAGRGFGDSAGARFWSFARLWAWTAVPWAGAAFVLLIGLGLLGDAAIEMMTWSEFFLSLAGHALPGVLALSFVACAVDHARVLLVLGPPAAGRSLLGALRLVTSGTRPLASFLAYVAFWLVVSLVYIACTAGRAWAGAGGALALFVLRQIVLGSRFAARVALTADQVAYVTERAPPPTS